MVENEDEDYDFAEAKNRAVRWAYLFAAVLCVLLAFLAMALPLLSSLPFFFLALICLAKGSRKIYKFVTRNKYVAKIKRLAFKLIKPKKKQ